MLYIACAVLWLLRFALGASIFSFLGVVIWRLPRGESVVKGRSHCPACGRTLSAAELVPCLSFLVQGGRCRGCGARIPARDFCLEVLGGVCSCACCAAFGGETARAALAFAVLGILTVVAFMDIDTLEIYDRFPALLLVCGAAAQFVFPGPGMRSRLLGCVIVSLPMLLLALVVPGGFGGGDIKLMAGAGFFLGARLTVVAAFLGILLGGGFGALLLAAKKGGSKDPFRLRAVPVHRHRRRDVLRGAPRRLVYRLTVINEKEGQHGCIRQPPSVRRTHAVPLHGKGYRRKDRPRHDGGGGL